MLLPSILRILLTRSFKPFIFKNKNESTLKFNDLENPGLYVHIPFCMQICDFCPYYKEKYDDISANNYLDALLKEIDIVCSALNEKKTVTSLYFGGGTPSLLLHGLQKIIGKLEKYFIITDGIGVELHPDDICENTLNALKKYGVNMLSIGVQSFDSECLKSLGRKNCDFTKKLELVKSFNFSVIDVDLIFGIPNQTKNSLINDITTAFENGATQVSTYPFIDFSFANNKYKPVKESEKKEMLAAIAEHTSLNNIERTSVWTFSKKGTKKYSSVTRDSFLGFGASAATLLRESFKMNTFSIPDYIKQVNKNNLATSLTLSFTKRQRACYFLFWSCYSMLIDTSAFNKMIGKTIERLFGLELMIGEKTGLIKKENNNYRLTEKGAYFYHKTEQAYTTAYIDKSWKISRIQAFPEKIILN